MDNGPRIMSKPLPPTHRTHRRNGSSGISQSGSYHNRQSTASGSPTDDVLSSFNQYPIRKVIELAGYYEDGSPLDPTQDALVQDLQAHAGDLVSTLLPILHTEEGDAGTSFDINNCKGVNHIAGSMMPPATEDDYSRISSPTSRSSLSSTGQAQSAAKSNSRPSLQYKPPIIKQEMPPPSPIKPETPTFQTSFQFVVNENAKEARNTVRKHVMKEFRRRERWEQSQKDNGIPPAAEEKLPPPRKRKRKQSTADDNESPSESQRPPDLQLITETAERRSSDIHDLPSAVSDHNGQSMGTLNSPVIPRNGHAQSSSHKTPLKKKRKPLIQPVFPESKELQLWGAVSTDYDNAILELESNTNSETGPHRHDPWASVAVGQVDPFSKLNLDLGPATQSLLHHFAWVMPSLMDSIVTGKTFHRIGWLYSAVAIHDPTPVHVILGYTLGHIASLRGLEEPPQALEHKSKAIKLLNRRMSDAEQCYSDGLIGAIVNFAGWELICANPKAYSMHMSGLGRIVTARGGMSAFQDNPELEKVIVRLDAIRAYISQSSPRYPAFSCVRELKPVAINTPRQPETSTWSTTQSSHTPWSYLYCEDALGLMNKLEDVLLVCRSAATDLSGPVGEPFHRLLIKSVEQMLTMPSILEDEEGRKSPNDIYAAYAPHQNSGSTLPKGERRKLLKSAFALRLAALTLLDAAIREFFDSPPYPGYYTAQLNQKFLGSKAMANDTAWGRSLEMLVAVLLQADRMALERPWRAWYAADALTLTMRIGEWTWEEVGQTLQTWVQEGGLDSSQPRIVDLTDINKGKSGRPVTARHDHSDPAAPAHGDSNMNLSRSADIDPEPRSKDVWDLRETARKFITDWQARSSSSSPAVSSYPPPSRQSPTQGQSSKQDSSSSSTAATTPATAPQRRKSQHASQMNVNVGIGSGDGLGNGLSTHVPVSMSDITADQPASTRYNPATNNGHTANPW